MIKKRLHTPADTSIQCGGELLRLQSVTRMRGSHKTKVTPYSICKKCSAIVKDVQAEYIPEK